MSSHSNGQIQRVTFDHAVNTATNRPTWKSTCIGVCECGHKTDPKATASKARKAPTQHAAEMAALDAVVDTTPIDLEATS